MIDSDQETGDGWLPRLDELAQARVAHAQQRRHAQPEATCPSQTGPHVSGGHARAESARTHPDGQVSSGRVTSVALGGPGGAEVRQLGASSARRRAMASRAEVGRLIRFFSAQTMRIAARPTGGGYQMNECD